MPYKKFDSQAVSKLSPNGENILFQSNSFNFFNPRLKIRNVVVSKDIKLIHQWLEKSRKLLGRQRKLSIAYLTNNYVHKLVGGKMQLFCVLKEAYPITFVEITPASKTWIKAFFEINVLDYCLKFLWPPEEDNLVSKNDPVKLTSAVVICIVEILLQFESVERLITYVENKQSNAVQIFENAGFEIISNSLTRYKKVYTMLIYTKSSKPISKSIQDY